MCSQNISRFSWTLFFLPLQIRHEQPRQPLVGNGGTMTIERSLPHGNVAAVLGTMQNIGLDQFIAARPCRERSLVMAMIADRILSPGSKLSCSAGMRPDTAQHTLAEELQLGEVDVHELYDAMDWLLERRARMDFGTAHGRHSVTHGRGQNQPFIVRRKGSGGDHGRRTFSR